MAKPLFFLFLLLMTGTALRSQTGLRMLKPKLLFSQSIPVGSSAVLAFRAFYHHTPVSPKAVILPVPSNYYTIGFGFFCRKEWQLEKKIKVPVRFRLGSLDYCNKLEGK